MRGVWSVLVGLVLGWGMIGTAHAAGALVGPNRCEMAWTQPNVNTDGSPLTDLAGWRLYVYTTAGQPGETAVATIPAPVPNPASPVAMTWDCKGLGLSDGQKYAFVKAVDLGLLESAAPAESPFVWNGVPPGVPSGFVVR